MSIPVSRVLYFSKIFHRKNRVMGIGQKLSYLVGNWKGTNRLFVPWMPEKIKESESTATIVSKMNGQFLSVEYAWSFNDELQEGLLILGCDPKCDDVQAVWTDSWHSKDVLMLCNGKVASDGSISVFGKYAVEDHPDWGWRTEIVPGEHQFKYVMYNVTPEGAEDIAVETTFVRS